MKSVKMAWVLGAVAAFGLGASVEACSSSSTPVTPGVDAGGSGTGSSKGSGTSGTSGSGTGVTPGTDGGGTTGSGSGCHAAPGMIYAEKPDSGFYCPFSKDETIDGGKTAYCNGGSQHCCEPTTDGVLSTCVASGTSCGAAADFTDWQCEGTPDCASTPGQICCGTGQLEMQAACGNIPAYDYVSEFKGSVCATSCTTGTQFQICSQDSECGGGVGSCQAIEPKGNTIGYCAKTGPITTPDAGSTPDAGKDTGTATPDAAKDTGTKG